MNYKVKEEVKVKIYHGEKVKFFKKNNQILEMIQGKLNWEILSKNRENQGRRIGQYQLIQVQWGLMIIDGKNSINSLVYKNRNLCLIKVQVDLYLKHQKMLIIDI